MKAIECVLFIYSYSGCIIDEIKFDSINKAIKHLKNRKALSAYCYAIYDNNMKALKEGKF